MDAGGSKGGGGFARIIEVAGFAAHSVQVTQG